MIFDAHMHVGDFGPLFGVSLDGRGLEELMRENDYGGRCRLQP